MFWKEVEFFGCIVNKNGFSIGFNYIEIINNWFKLENIKDVEWLCGFVNYYWNFRKNFVELIIFLYVVIGKNRFYWGDE